MYPGVFPVACTVIVFIHLPGGDSGPELLNTEQPPSTTGLTIVIEKGNLSWTLLPLQLDTSNFQLPSSPDRDSARDKCKSSFPVTEQYDLNKLAPRVQWNLCKVQNPPEITNTFFHDSGHKGDAVDCHQFF